MSDKWNWGAPQWVVSGSAMAEIERLRAENEMLKSNLPARAVTRGLAEQHNEITRFRAENEKLREALAAERERCAKIADNACKVGDDPEAWATAEEIAAAIRESGNE